MTGVLTVRQLFVLSTVLKQHGCSHLRITHYLKRRRKDQVFTTPSTSLSFGQKHSTFLGPRVYNKINSILNVSEDSDYKCKTKVSKFLQDLSYQDTENLLLSPN